MENKLNKHRDNRVLDPSEYFRFSNGNEARSIEELIYCLENVDDVIYFIHVNGDKNDFSNWIKGVLNENELAEDVRYSDRENMISILKASLNDKSKFVKEEEKIIPEKESVVDESLINESKMNKMSESINKIKTDLEKPEERKEDIDVALNRLKRLYQEKLETDNPTTIVMHDQISDKQSHVNLKEDIKLDNDNKAPKEDYKEKINIEENNNLEDEKENERRHLKLTDKLKEFVTRTKANSEEIKDVRDIKEVEKLERENNDLKEKMKILKCQVKDDSNREREYEKNIREKYEEIEGLKKIVIELKDNIKDLKFKNQNISDENSDLNEKIEKLKKKENTSLEDLNKMKKLKGIIDQRDVKIEGLKTEIRKHLEEKEDLKNKAERESEKHKKIFDVAEEQIMKTGHKIEEIDRRERDLKKRELEMDEVEKIIREEKNLLKRKEREIETVREEYIDDVKLFLKHKKDVVLKEKELIALSIRLEKEKEKLKEKEKDHGEKDRNYKKRISKYENDVSELRKELKNLV